MPQKQKNKGGNNGFFFFMQHLKNKQGRTYRTMKDVSEAAAPLWNRMSAAEKKPFDDQARTAKGEAKKMTSLNEEINMLEKNENAEAEEKRFCEESTKKLIKELFEKGTEKEHYFHIIHMNKFCTIRRKEVDLPAEFAMIRFNLLNGVLNENIIHSLINPGELELGYNFEVKQFAEMTHQLKYPDEESDLPDMQSIMSQIVSFLSKDCGVRELPIIYVIEKDLKLVRSILDEACFNYDYRPNPFRLCSLEYFFFILRNNIKSGDWPTKNQAVMELQRDVYDYTPGICCNYHESTDAPLFCSRSIIIRNVYIICDNCCKLLGVKLIPGRHVKIGSNLVPEPVKERVVTRMPAKFTGAAASANYKENNEGYTSDGSEMFSALSVMEESDSTWTEVVKKSNIRRKELMPPTFLTDDNSSPQSSQSRSQPMRKPTKISACVLAEEIGNASNSGAYDGDEIAAIYFGQEPVDNPISLRPIGRGRGKLLTGEKRPGVDK